MNNEEQIITPYYKVPEPLMKMIIAQVLKSDAKISDGIRLMQSLQSLEKVDGVEEQDIVKQEKEQIKNK